MAQEVDRINMHNFKKFTATTARLSFKSFSLSEDIVSSSSLKIRCDVDFCLTADIGTDKCAFNEAECPTGYSFTPWNYRIKNKDIKTPLLNSLLDKKYCESKQMIIIVISFVASRKIKNHMVLNQLSMASKRRSNTIKDASCSLESSDIWNYLPHISPTQIKWQFFVITIIISR